MFLQYQLPNLMTTLFYLLLFCFFLNILFGTGYLQLILACCKREDCDAAAVCTGNFINPAGKDLRSSSTVELKQVCEFNDEVKPFIPAIENKTNNQLPSI